MKSGVENRMEGVSGDDDNERSEVKSAERKHRSKRLLNIISK